MAKRPIFAPNFSGFPHVDTVDIEFKWHPGFAKSQLQKSIASLHTAAEKLNEISPILEISSKSTSRLGVSLSAFNLSMQTLDGQRMNVECAYQGSKVFENGGPYHELYSRSSRAAKTDERLRNSGDLIGFNFSGEDFPTEPKTAFYELVIHKSPVPAENRILCKNLKDFKASQTSFSIQIGQSIAKRVAAALFVSLSKNGLINEQVLQDKEHYLALITGKEQPMPIEPTPQQLTLPLPVNQNFQIDTLQIRRCRNFLEKAGIKL